MDQATPTVEVSPAPQTSEQPSSGSKTQHPIVHETPNGDRPAVNGSGHEKAPFKLLQQWHSQPRNIRIIHIGAGATGLCTAFKFERGLTDYELVCYEKNDEVGGTWLENRYPGCACDVPAHVYTYTFEPNPEWKSYYAYSPDIHKYFLNFCEKYQLRKYIKLKHRVLSAKWHEDKGQWEVEVQKNGEVFTDWCHVLMNGSGLLNKWKWPSIKGLESFKGPRLHSAHWDQNVDYNDKRVAVIGTGSSAIQIIPQVRKMAKRTTCFMRGCTWISPPMPRVQVEVPQTENSTPVVADPEDAQSDIGQYFYKDFEIERLRKDPEYLLKYRKQIEYGINKACAAMVYKNSEASRMTEMYMRAEMTRRLDNHPVLTKKLIPSWSVGCRRLTPGDGYLEALIQPDVEHVFCEITSIDETGLNTEDGAHHEVDVLVCATGFNMAWTPHFKLHGIGGIDIKDEWSPMPKCYLGLAAPGFPNYFVMNGPRANLANGTVLPCFETEIDYVIAAVKKMQSDRIKSLNVKEYMADKLNEYIDAWHEKSVFSDKCRSWYKNNTIDGKVMTWGGSAMHFLKSIKTPRWEHYNIEYMDENPWAFLGNGKIKSEVEGDFEGMTSYLRNSDVPWSIV